jgi:hypothetical protein
MNYDRVQAEKPNWKYKNKIRSFILPCFDCSIQVVPLSSLFFFSSSLSVDVCVSVCARKKRKGERQNDECVWIISSVRSRDREKKKKEERYSCRCVTTVSFKSWTRCLSFFFFRACVKRKYIYIYIWVLNEIFFSMILPSVCSKHIMGKNQMHMNFVEKVRRLKSKTNNPLIKKQTQGIMMNY